MGRLFRDGTNPVWAVFTALYVVTALALAFYWLFTETGPVGWLGDLQAETLFKGSWYPKITTAVVILVEFVPLFILKLAIESITGKRLTAPVD